MRIIKESVIYENPLPQLRSAQSMFPSLCVLDDGVILASHQMGEAFEAVNCTSQISRSADGGNTWSEPAAMFDKRGERPVKSDCCKLCSLGNGRVAALGMQYERFDENLPIGNAETGGVLDSQVFFAESLDSGKTFGKRRVIDMPWGPHTEATAPITVAADGSWVSPAANFPDWKGELSEGLKGRLLRSDDEGNTWNADAVCMDLGGEVACYEQRMCVLGSGALVVIAWNENVKTGERLDNHFAISTDNGATWGAPKSTGVRGQASSVCSIGGERILALHSLRRDTDRPGIYGFIVDLSKGRWDILERSLLWEPKTPLVRDNHMAGIFAYVKFGQPSAVALPGGEALMCFWHCEQGAYKTVAARIAFN